MLAFPGGGDMNKVLPLGPTCQGLRGPQGLGEVTGDCWPICAAAFFLGGEGG